MFKVFVCCPCNRLCVLVHCVTTMFPLCYYCVITVLLQEHMPVSLKMCVELQVELHAQPSIACVLCASYAAA